MIPSCLQPTLLAAFCVALAVSGCNEQRAAQHRAGVDAEGDRSDARTPDADSHDVEADDGVPDAADVSESPMDTVDSGSPDLDGEQTGDGPDAPVPTSVCEEALGSVVIRTRLELERYRDAGCAVFGSLAILSGEGEPPVRTDLSALAFVEEVRGELALHPGRVADVVSTAGMTNLRYVGTISYWEPESMYLREINFGDAVVGTAIDLEAMMGVRSIRPLANLRLEGDVQVNVWAQNAPACQADYVQTVWRNNGWTPSRQPIFVMCRDCPCDVEEP